MKMEHGNTGQQHSSVYIFKVKFHFFQCDYDVTLGGITHKSWYLCGAESFTFSQQLAQIKKSSTMNVLNLHSEVHT